MSSDPRGPMRLITGIVERSDGTAIATDCGHEYDRNQSFTYKVGALIRCVYCANGSAPAHGDKP